MSKSMISSNIELEVFSQGQLIMKEQHCYFYLMFSIMLDVYVLSVIVQS
jgi:hypothetical protein